jgi:hypothetical protein
MNVRSGLKAAFFRLPADLDDGIKLIASHRGEAAAVVVREILREGLFARGVIDNGFPVRASHADSAAGVAPVNAKDFR